MSWYNSYKSGLVRDLERYLKNNGVIIVNVDVESMSFYCKYDLYMNEFIQNFYELVRDYLNDNCIEPNFILDIKIVINNGTKNPPVMILTLK
jgi:hypothetical protein